MEVLVLFAVIIALVLIAFTTAKYAVDSREPGDWYPFEACAIDLPPTQSIKTLL